MVASELEAPSPTELERAHATIRRLNRRVQSAESGLAEKINANAGRTLGRAFANAAATMYLSQLDDLRSMLPTPGEAVELLWGLEGGIHKEFTEEQFANLTAKLRRLTESAEAVA
jgi:predicted hydrocarbon binding protein